MLRRAAGSARETFLVALGLTDVAFAVMLSYLNITNIIGTIVSFFISIAVRRKHCFARTVSEMETSFLDVATA